MFLRRTGLKYKFLTISIAAIVISATLCRMALHFLIKSNQNYSIYYVFVVALFFIIIGVSGVLVVTKLMVQPVVSLTKKVYDVQQDDLDVKIEDNCQGAPPTRCCC